MDNLEIIERNTKEIVNKDKIKSFMGKGIAYCGYECSGEIHLGHLVTILKLMDLQKVGIKVKVLLADWHTWLNKKGDWKFVESQLKNWKKGIKAIGLESTIVNGTSFQKKPEYFEDVLKLSLNVTVNRGVRAMQQVARDKENTKISQIIYPLMQIEDVKKLGVNFVVAGSDQRKIYALGTDKGKEIGLPEAVYLYTEIIPSLKGNKGKMSSSVPESLISIRDSKKEIEKKINKAYCPHDYPKREDVENNPILAISKLIIFPKFGEMLIKGDEKWRKAGDSSEVDRIFNSYGDLEKEFKNGFVYPQNLKNAVAEYLEKIIAPIRKNWK